LHRENAVSVGKIAFLIEKKVLLNVQTVTLDIVFNVLKNFLIVSDFFLVGVSQGLVRQFFIESLNKW
jgi:hypothetical protein